MLNIIIIIVLGLVLYKYNIFPEIEKYISNTLTHTLKYNESEANTFPRRIDLELIERNIEELNTRDIPEEIDGYKFIGLLDMNNKNKLNDNILIYGRKLENVHNLYSYHVIFTDGENILKRYTLKPHEEYKEGDVVWVNNGPEKIGPFFLRLRNL